MKPGTRVGPYEIVAPIGAGGMGEVYRARDTKLGRDVAIKVLPQSLAADRERLARFEREARLLASLNHPNIAAIYGLESVPTPTGQAPALVLELVDGPELAEHVASLSGLLEVARVRQILTLAQQIAEALDAAHERGVIHRDLKPRNIKVTRDGVVKVLDFGLAKSSPGNTAGADLTNSPTMTIEGTLEGLILGTAAYMSPEQARGLPLDRRTDIWSFGCVLFEMLSGRRAFSGDTSSDLIAAILHHEPDYSALPQATPPIVRRLLRRSLEKDPRQRLRDIADARADIDEALSGSGEPAPPGRREAALSHRAGLAPLALAAAALAIGGVGSAAGWFAARWSIEEPPPSFDHIVRIVSTPAHENSPAISPDGKWVAYLSNARGPTDVWVKFVSGGDPANLTASSGLTVQATDYVSGLDISPDGTQIAFSVTSREQRSSSWAIPAPLGGVPRRLLPDGSSGFRWSPDGKRAVFVRTGGPLGDALVVADSDGQNEMVIAKREGAQHIHWPQWSADGRYVYFNHGPQNFNIEPTQIYRVRAAGGPLEPVVVTARRAAFPFLDPLGGGLIYAGNPDTVDLNLWWRDLKTGRDTRLTSGIGEYTQPSLSADGRRLVGTILDARQSLGRLRLSSNSAAQIEPVTDGYAGDVDPTWSSDGSRLAFASSRTGNRNLWIMDKDLTHPAPLTSGPAIDERPAFSPDGRQIAFVSDRGGRRGIWVVGADGGTPRFVAPADVVDTLSWSPDGRRLVYATPIGDAPGLSIMDVADGKTTRVPTPAAATGPSWSESDVIAFVEPRGGTIGAFAQLVQRDGRRVESSKLDGPDAPQIANGVIAWSPDGKRIAAASLPGAGAGSIWLIDPAANAPFKKIMDLPAGVFVRGLTWQPDGSSIIFGQYRWSGDIFLADRKDAH